MICQSLGDSNRRSEICLGPFLPRVTERVRPLPPERGCPQPQQHRPHYARAAAADSRAPCISQRSKCRDARRAGERVWSLLAEHGPRQLQYCPKYGQMPLFSRLSPRPLPAFHGRGYGVLPVLHRCVSHVDLINMGDTPAALRLHTVASPGLVGAGRATPRLFRRPDPKALTLELDSHGQNDGRFALIWIKHVGREAHLLAGKANEQAALDVAVGLVSPGALRHKAES